MADLSPAAESVWEAFNLDKPGVLVDYGECLAAALKAAALYCPHNRHVLLMIASELEGHGPL